MHIFLNMNTGKKLVFLALSVALLAGGVYILNLNTGNEAAPEQTWKTYESDTLGLRFEYPDYYFLETKEVGDGHRGHFVIILTEDTEENKLVREGKAPGREGPTAITFDLYQSPETLDPVVWMKGSSGSNYKLSPDGAYEEFELSGKLAASYSWDGLYRADNIAVSHNDYVASIAVTYLTPEDAIRSDFKNILDTIVFY